MWALTGCVALSIIDWAWYGGRRAIRTADDAQVGLAVIGIMLLACAAVAPSWQIAAAPLALWSQRERGWKIMRLGAIGGLLVFITWQLITGWPLLFAQSQQQRYRNGSVADQVGTNRERIATLEEQVRGLASQGKTLTDARIPERLAVVENKLDFLVRGTYVLLCAFLVWFLKEFLKVWKEHIAPPLKGK